MKEEKRTKKKTTRSDDLTTIKTTLRACDVCQQPTIIDVIDVGYSHFQAECVNCGCRGPRACTIKDASIAWDNMSSAWTFFEDIRENAKLRDPYLALVALDRPLATLDIIFDMGNAHWISVKNTIDNRQIWRCEFYPDTPCLKMSITDKHNNLGKLQYAINNIDKLEDYTWHQRIYNSQKDQSLYLTQYFGIDFSILGEEIRRRNMYAQRSSFASSRSMEESILKGEHPEWISLIDATDKAT